MRRPTISWGRIGLEALNLTIPAKRLRKIKPDLKMLYMSGYPGEFIARHGVSGAETGYLQKPFSQEALAGKMREVLDG